MHLGHARTALVTWLRARKLGGEILMRIEDIDQPRVVAGSADAICRDLEWLGLGWDEGPVFQSAHTDSYERALDVLQSAGLVYPCTCSRKDIAKIASAPHGDEGPRYPGTCRGGASKPGKPAALRFIFDDPAPGFDDAICGAHPAGRNGGDFVLRRADGTWAYHLAVVVDDASADITEVIRAADLLPSTPRQIALYRALGHEVPRFAHVGLVVDERGTRLSKRHGATPIESLRAQGRTSEQIIGELAFSLGLMPSSAPVRAAELISGFQLTEISGSSFTWNAGG